MAQILWLGSLPLLGPSLGSLLPFSGPCSPFPAPAGRLEAFKRNVWCKVSGRGVILHNKSKELAGELRGIPAVAQWNWWHFWSARTRVQSPAQHSGLKIRCCRSCGSGRHCSSDLIPGLGKPYASGRPKKKRENGGHRELSSGSGNGAGEAGGEGGRERRTLSLSVFLSF